MTQKAKGLELATEVSIGTGTIPLKLPTKIPTRKTTKWKDLEEEYVAVTGFAMAPIPPRSFFWSVGNNTGGWHYLGKKNGKKIINEETVYAVPKKWYDAQPEA